LKLGAALSKHDDGEDFTLKSSPLCAVRITSRLHGSEIAAASTGDDRGDLAMPHVALNGTSIHYEHSGVRGAPALLLSNSLGTMMDMWEPQLEALRQKYTLIRYDVRGHGKSAVLACPYTIEQLGGDVIALMDGDHDKTPSSMI
jgi:hypothetical protein